MKPVLRHFTSLALCLAMVLPVPANEKTAVQSGNAFALDLYAQLAKENTGANLFFSPYSISNALAMTAEGARGKTALEMGTVLRLPKGDRQDGNDDRPWDWTKLHAGFGKLSQAYNREDQPYALRIANAIWGDKSFPFNDAFVEAINSNYHTEALRLADFAGNSEAERQRINAWVEKATEKRIQDLLPEGSIDALTRIVLANAIYFKGDWETPFRERYTKEGDFRLGDGKTAKAELMHGSAIKSARYAAFQADGTFFDTPKLTSHKRKTVGYPRSDGFAVAELFYKGRDLSMVMIAPLDADGLPAIEKKLTSANLSAWLGKLANREVHVTMPKFKSTSTFVLNDTLKAMGMPSAFEGSANFNGMKEGESSAGLFISLVAHKAFVEVNETGTEAAAATAVVGALRSAPAVQPFIPEFRADRPFLYLIRDVKTGNILFLGRMLKP